MPIPQTALSRIRLLIFDLDGTLVDSESDLTLSVNAMREQMGLAALPRQTISSYVGRGVATLINRALGAAVASEKVKKATEFFLEHYRSHMLDHTIPYAGVRESLEELKPWQLAVLTNKPVRFSRDMLASLDLAKYFSAVYGGDSFAQKKPDPMGIIQLMNETGTEPSLTMMIGDSDTDVLTGRNAGAWACGVSYGMGSNTLETTPPDFMLRDLRDLPLLLNGRGAHG